MDINLNIALNKIINKCQVTGCNNTFGNLKRSYIFNINNHYLIKHFNKLSNTLLLRNDILTAWERGFLTLSYNTKQIFFKVNDNIKLSETYLYTYESSEYNIININIDNTYFEEYCYFINLRNS